MSQCKECANNQEKPKVWVAQTLVTGLYAMEYTGPDGKLHKHDTNRETKQYKCSNGHNWLVTSRPGQCHCGWKAEETTGTPK